MKTKGKEKLVIPEIIVIDGKMYQPLLTPINVGSIKFPCFLSTIALREIQSEDEE